LYPNASNDGNSNDNFPDDGFPYGSFGKTLSGAGSLLQSPADLQQLWLCVSKKNYADVSKKLLHNHFKLLD